MAMPYCEAGETTLGRLDRAGDKWGLPPFRDKTMKGKKTRRNEASNTNEHPLRLLALGSLAGVQRGHRAPRDLTVQTPPPLPRSYLENRSQVTQLVWCRAFNSLDSDCRRQTCIFPLHLPTRPSRRGPDGVTSPWTLKLRCVPFCREEIQCFGDPGLRGGGRFGESSCWLEPDACSSKQDANGISAGNAALELHRGRLSSLSWPPGLCPQQRNPSGCSSPALVSHSPLGLMEPKSSAWLLQVQGMAIREAALVDKTISTLSITHGGQRCSSRGSILPALPSPGQQQPGCIQPLHQLPA